jgi:protein-L-isoaspartate(D-aspartate) O-methyltransferase
MNPKDRYALQRDAMISRDLVGRDIRDRRVLAAMVEIPRENFLPPGYQPNAYEDNPLPIGLGQTISQPYIVALMTQCLELKGDEEVLEIGTGSGYQTAILSRLCRRVYTIERFGDLSIQAQTVLSSLEIHNVEYAVGDGSCGWPGPKIQFDRILITAAIPSVPQPLALQLSDGGILVAPIGDMTYQTLMVYQSESGKFKSTEVCGCRFVKLVGKFGFQE